MEQTALPAWSGAEEDYERVCTVEDLIGAIAVGEAAQALVMGDEPAGTTFIPALGVFVRSRALPFIRSPRLCALAARSYLSVAHPSTK